MSGSTGGNESPLRKDLAALEEAIVEANTFAELLLTYLKDMVDTGIPAHFYGAGSEGIYSGLLSMSGRVRKQTLAAFVTLEQRLPRPGGSISVPAVTASELPPATKDATLN